MLFFYLFKPTEATSKEQRNQKNVIYNGFEARERGG